MTIAYIYGWMLLFTRAGGLIAFLPGISAAPVPMQVRIAVAAFLALAAEGFVSGIADPPGNLGLLAIIILHELLIGLMMGFAARLIFYAVEFAGQLMSSEIGMSLSTQMDPISRQSTTAIGTLVYYFALVMFFASGCHHEVIAAFMRSFAIAPVGIPVFSHNVAEFFVQQTGNIFLIALQMASPLMAVNFSVTFTFAILGKAAPAMSVFSESFAVRILAGMTLLGLTFGLTAQIVLSHLRESPELMLRMIP